MRLVLDYESRCALDLRKVGAYRYVHHHTFKAFMVSYAIDEGDVVTLFEEDSWQDFFDVLMSADTIVAHNVMFERLVTEVTFPVDIPVENWDCTAARARAAGLPGALDKCAEALNFAGLYGDAYRKDPRGRRLINRYCKPMYDGTFRAITPEDRDAWCDYSRTDTEILRLLDQTLPPLGPHERKIFLYDMTLNDRGIGVDLDLLEGCRQVARQAEAEIRFEIGVLTRDMVGTATQQRRIMHALTDRLLILPDLRRRTVAAALDESDLHPDTRRLLELRAEGSRTSIGKLDSMAQRQHAGRLHGMLLYHGASTGRHSSVGVQLQNLPRPGREWSRIESALPDLQGGSAAQVREAHGSPQDLVADSLRSLLVPRAGHVFEVVDLNAVELRGAAWLAGEQWLLEYLTVGIDVYCVTASRVLGRDVTPDDDHDRFLGKTLELAGQYGMGPDKFVRTCADQDVQVDFEVGHRSIATYRETHKAIVNMWYGLERAAYAAVRQPGTRQRHGRIAFAVVRGWLRMLLPSGRWLSYYHPQFDEGRLCYMGVNSVTHQFSKLRLWGAMLFEHAVQALCRDVLMSGCFRLEEAGHPVQLIVHDETVTEVGVEHACIKTAETLLATPPDWASDLPLAAKGRILERYRKI